MGTHELGPAPVDGDAGPRARCGHPAVAGAHRNDLDLLGAEPTIAHEDEARRFDGPEDASVEDSGVVRGIPRVDAALAPRAWSPVGGREGRTPRSPGPDIGGGAACNQRRRPDDTSGDR